MTENTTTYPISRSRTTQGSYLYPTLLANTIRRSPSMMYILLISTLLLDQPFSLYRRTILAQLSHCNSCRSTIRDLGYRCRRDDSRLGRSSFSAIAQAHRKPKRPTIVSIRDINRQRKRHIISVAANHGPSNGDAAPKYDHTTTTITIRDAHTSLIVIMLGRILRSLHVSPPNPRSIESS